MSIVETLLVYAGIPLAVVATVAALVMGTGRGSTRYRPGRSFAFTPVWFLSARSGGEPASVLADPGGPALPPAAPRAALESAAAVPELTDAATGGARGTW